MVTNDNNFNYQKTGWREYVEYRLDDAKEVQKKATNDSKEKYEKIDNKLDTILAQNREHITMKELELAIGVHAKSCPATKASPIVRNNTLDIVKDNSKFLAIIGGLVGIITVLVQALFGALGS